MRAWSSLFPHFHPNALHHTNLVVDVTHPQELGPRFSLKLEMLQKGTFDTTGGEFEWMRKKDSDASRRKFSL